MKKIIKNIIVFLSVFIVVSFLSSSFVYALEPTPPRVSTQPASNIETGTATLKGSVDPNGLPTVYWFEWGLAANGLINKSSEQYIGSGTSVVYVLFGSSSLKEGSLYFFRIVAKNDKGISYGSTRSFGTKNLSSISLGSLPRISTNSAADIGITQVTLKGSVDPEGLDTFVWFEWGTASGGLFSETSRRSTGSGTRSISYLIRLAGLSEDTTYFYRAVAKNEAGATFGSTRSFKTKEKSNSENDNNSSISCNAPMVATISVGSVTQDSAILKGTVSPRSHTTKVWFEYGKSVSLGKKTSSQFLSNHSSGMNTNQSVEGLDSGTKYYFKIFAESECGRVSGSSDSFTTLGSSVLLVGSSVPSGSTGSQPFVLPTSVKTHTQIGTQSVSVARKASVSVFDSEEGFDTDLLIPSVNQTELEAENISTKENKNLLSATVGFFSSGINILFLMVLSLVSFAGFYFYQTNRQFYRLIKEV